MENRSKPASLLTAESIMLGVRHEKEGKLRVTYVGWDDAKVVLDGQVLELVPQTAVLGKADCADEVIE